MGEITLRQAIEEYKNIYLPARNLADRTRGEYINDLEDLARFLESMGKCMVETIALIHLERYLAELDRKGYAGSTRKRKAIVIRSFLSFLYRDGFIGSNIAHQLIPPFPDNRSPRFLTLNEQERLLRACSNNPRDRAIIMLFLQTGIALSELTRLRVNDIELPENLHTDQNVTGLLHVSGSRGRKSRRLSLNLKVCQAIGQYIKFRRDDLSDILFVNKFDYALGARGVQKLVRKYLDKAGIKDASVHTLRHTYGALLTAAGVRLKTIQDIMGLKEIRSARIYESLAKEITEG